MRAMISTCVLFAMFAISDLHAKRRKKFNCLRGIVVFEMPDKPPIKATGFVAEYNGKSVVFSNLSVVFHCANPVIKTIDGKILEYKRILIPDDKRYVLYFELAQSVDPTSFKPLEFQDDITEEIDIKTHYCALWMQGQPHRRNFVKRKSRGHWPDNN